MKKYLLAVMFFALPVSILQAQDPPVAFGDFAVDDVPGLREFVEQANANPGGHQATLRPDPLGGCWMQFPDPAQGFDRALQPIEGFLILDCVCGDDPCILSPAPGMEGAFGFVETHDGGKFHGRNLIIQDFGVPGNGGAFLATDDSGIHLVQCQLRRNNGRLGGGISIEDRACAIYDRVRSTGNHGQFFGDDVNTHSRPLDKHAFEAFNSLFGGPSARNPFENEDGNMFLQGNTITTQDSAFDSTGGVHQFNTAEAYDDVAGVQAKGRPVAKPEALCNDFGSKAFTSLGYNIASDDSCALDHETDLPSTDPMLADNDDGLPMPQAGSPAIDSGPTDVIVFDGDTLASLPCGYRDFSGTARPQDANGDGVFECDRGAMEVQGAGAIVPGHSSVFYNPARSGEGNYVEILDGGRAIIYTFTYNPDGTGPAWFLGVANIVGNALVLDALARPTGTPFGADFDATEIEYTPAGSMSMVFPDCAASAPGGNIAYTGNAALGYEGLITRATRLAHITGCGAETPSPNAGLSASYYDPARSGEGLIVEWLSNGDVLVVFFTYDTDGNQFWLFGQATPNGKTVTINAVYPTGFTPWGRNFDTNDVVLSPWGTFTLTWTDCNTLVFEYDSIVGTFGAATLNYTRLSKLAGTECPMFP